MHFSAKFNSNDLIIYQLGMNIFLSGVVYLQHLLLQITLTPWARHGLSFLLCQSFFVMCWQVVFMFVSRRRWVGVVWFILSQVLLAGDRFSRHGSTHCQRHCSQAMGCVRPLVTCLTGSSTRVSSSSRNCARSVFWSHLYPSCCGYDVDYVKKVSSCC